MSAVVAFTVSSEPLPEELDALFREHSRLVYRTAYSVTGSAQDAEDVVQGLFLHLLRRGIPLGVRENPAGYLYRAAVNLSLNAVKSRTRRETSEAASRRSSSATWGPPSGGPMDLSDRLVRAMSQLNPRQVEMLVLRYEHGHSTAEIGRLLGTSSAVVAVTLFRARARLKTLLSGDQS
jgi:RNA polymerase sigma-70 factor (ECF subfamily)